MDISKLFYFPPFFLNPSIPKGVKATEHATLTLIVLFLFSRETQFFVRTEKMAPDICSMPQPVLLTLCSH